MTENKKVLLADDDIFYAKIMRRHIVNAGYDVVIAINGKEAVESVRKDKPDLAILDIMLPQLDGFSVLCQIKQMGGDTAKIPVFMISNLAQETDKKKGMELGANEYIVKSDLTLKDIVDKIKNGDISILYLSPELLLSCDT